MQEAEGKLFEISQRNVKKDVTQINPVIKEAMVMLEKAANQKKVERSAHWFRRIGQNDVRMAEFRSYHHCRPSCDG